MLSRRTLLAAVAPGAALALAGCTAAQQQQAALDWTNFVDQVTAIVAKGCSTAQGYIPTANTIAAVVEALYPSLSAAVAGGLAAVEAAATSLCNAIPANPPAALVRKLRGSVRGVTSPVNIGTIVVNGKTIQVAGYGS